jgi:hypothetical protein
MYHPVGFTDSRNIVIHNGTPCYYNKGNLYKDKLIHGVALTTYFMQEDQLALPVEDSEQKEVTIVRINDRCVSRENLTTCLDYETSYPNYRKFEKKMYPNERKGKMKNILGKRPQKTKKTKKTKKVSGLDDKIFNINQRLVSVEEDKKGDEILGRYYYDYAEKEYLREMEYEVDEDYYQELIERRYLDEVQDYYDSVYDDYGYDLDYDY